eukprot:285495_1
MKLIQVIMVELWICVLTFYVITILCDTHSNNDIVRILLAGDVMFGYGIDQILEYQVKVGSTKVPKSQFERFYRLDQQQDLQLPPIEITSQPNYIWGDMIQSLEYYHPDIKILNIEGSITTSNEYWPNKPFRFRMMHPKNIYVLNEINHDKRLVCTLANNHVIDWGYKGLNETFQTLTKNNITFCGIGPNIDIAWKPSVIELSEDKNSRIFVFGVGSVRSGCPSQWAATTNRSGIAMMNPSDSSNDYIKFIMKTVKIHIENYIKGKKVKKNIIILSIHWGPNWSWIFPDKYRQFAHALIDYNDKNNDIGIDLIHGHSSHHIMGIEIYKNKAIFYGIGDTLDNYGVKIIHPNNYRYNATLGFLYFVDLNVTTGNVNNIILKGTQIKNKQIIYAQNESLIWLQYTMKRLCEQLNVTLYINEYDQTLRLHYDYFEEGVQQMESMIHSIAIDFNSTYFYWSLFIITVIILVFLAKKQILNVK